MVDHLLTEPDTVAVMEADTETQVGPVDNRLGGEGTMKLGQLIRSHLMVIRHFK